MVPKSRILFVATIVALSHAEPVCAQSFNRTEGTGNELPSYFDSSGGFHAGNAPQYERSRYAFAGGRHAIFDHVLWFR